MRVTGRSLVVVLLALVGVVLLGISNTMATLVPVLAATTALIMGGTGTPNPPPAYIAGQTGNYITPFYGANVSPVGVYTPEQFWPRSGSTLTFDESVEEGVDDLGTATGGYPGVPLIILGYSQSTRIASIQKRDLIEQNGDDFSAYPQWSYVLVSNVNRGNGGVLQRFNGLSIPILGVTFDGYTPTDSPENPNAPGDYALDTTDITFIHDGWSDFPIYPMNLPATLNAGFGILYLHGTYSSLQDPTLTPQGSLGDTDYYAIGTDIVPLLMPLQQLGAPKALLLAVDEPLRVLIESAYRRDISPGTPTTAYLIPIINPVSLAVNVVKAIPVGIDDGLQELGLGRALGTTPSGIYGVGGDDADLAGLPPGLIPLGSKSAPAAPEVPAGAREQETDLTGDDPEPVSPLVEQTEDDVVGQDTDDDTTEVVVTPDEPGTEDDTTELSTPTTKFPKPSLPLLRGPIQFDRPNLPSLKPSAGDRPLKRLVDALTGQKPVDTAKPDAPDNTSTGDDEAA